MFALDKQRATLAHVALRRERHGDKWVLGVSLKIRMTDSNVVLDAIDPQVRVGLYRNDVIGKQHRTDGQSTPMPRSEFIRNVPLAVKMKGAEVVFHVARTDSPLLSLYKATIDSFELEVIDGGSAPLEFMIKAPLDVVECATLAMVWLDEDVVLSITPGDSAQMEIPGASTKKADSGVGDSTGEVD